VTQKTVTTISHIMHHKNNSSHHGCHWVIGHSTQKCLIAKSGLFKGFLKLEVYKKFELMLTRCAKAYSSSGSVV